MRLVSLLFLALNGLAVFAQNSLPNPRPPYAAFPADNYYTNQWYLEQRDTNGVRIGPDLNARGAWSRTKGEGVIVAIVDDGVEMTHHDLATNALPDLSFDFEANATNGSPRTTSDNDGTANAGLVVAALDARGIVGVAPATGFASWKIYPTNSISGRSFIAPEKMANVFTYLSNTVAVQAHLWWESQSLTFVAPTNVELASISNAVIFGRNGQGVVMVRPAGDLHFNGQIQRWFGRNANDDAYESDPRVITVAAARQDGRVASYSERGACVLVAGFSGDLYGDVNQPFPNVWTTDRVGSAGLNQIMFPTEPDLADYVFGINGYSGTTASAAMVSGICALVLSVNPSLSYRDVQQILIHASRHFDKADPNLKRNAAGYWVTDRLGFGIPDAAEAVHLAETWHNRPPLARITVASDSKKTSIPDASLVVRAIAPDAAPAIDQTFIAFPGLGAQPDDPTASLPLVDLGQATNAITQDLHGKAALIERGSTNFSIKIGNAAAAGASFAIVYNNSATPPLTLMGLTDFVPIPAIFIRQSDGQTLLGLITNQPSLRVQLQTTPAVATFTVTNQMICEHVGVRVKTTHGSRQDLRISLVSPKGTRSLLQAFNLDTNPGPVDWTYWTVQNFYEPAAGQWRLEVVDEVEGFTGDLVGAEMTVEGTDMVDLDNDGLDDVWEATHFASLGQGPLDDPDGDGSWNAREQILGTDPNRNETPFTMTASNLQANAVRFAFPSVEGVSYTVRSTTDLNQPFGNVGTAVGDFGETEIVTDKSEAQRYFQIRAP